MNILVFDTSTDVEIVGASCGGITSNKTTRVRASHSATLFDRIADALRELKLDSHEINFIGVGIGPGSFTGIRIAVSTARMLAQALRVPLAGIHSTLLYASSVPNEGTANILVAFDAKKGRVFGALYNKKGESVMPETITPPGDYTIESLAGDIDVRYPTYLLGSGAEKFYESRAEILPNHILLQNFMPSGATACKLAEVMYLSSPDGNYDFNRVVPFYARRPDAELIKEKTRGKG